MIANCLDFYLVQSDVWCYQIDRREEKVVRVRIIEPTPKTVKKRRVCAYARVSSNTYLQNESLENQITYYEKLITSHSNYEYVGIFADRGITGTTNNRPEFQRMLKLARQGKIDLIITKSISRFARNTTIILQTVRELKDLDVEVIFENDNISTLSGEGELMLTVLSSFAEEESRSVSENIKWRVRRDFQRGKVHINTVRFFGYDKDGNGNLVINEKEALLVRRIFDLYLEGLSCSAITRIFAEEGIKTFRGKDKWGKTAVLNILQNEKYQGDVLCQKTYVENHLSKRSVRNRGKVNQYYIKDNHPALVSREIWEKAQQIMVEHRNNQSIKPDELKNKYFYSGLLFCSKCGALLTRIVQHSNKPYRKCVWQCINYNKKGKATCTGTTISEMELAKANIQEPTIVTEVIKDGEKHYTYSSKNG